MKYQVLGYNIFLKILAFVFILQSSPGYSATKPKTVAVLSFKVLHSSPEYKHLGEGQSENITTHLTKFKTVEIIERNQLNKAIQELELSQTGLVDDKTAQQLGKLVGARYIIIGSIEIFSKQVEINGRVIEVETGKSIIADKERGKLDDMFEVRDKMGYKISKSFTKFIEAKHTILSSDNEGDISSEKVFLKEWIEKGENADPNYGGINLKRAIECYRRAVAIDNKNFNALFHLGSALIQQGKYVEANGHLIKAVKIDPKNADLLTRIGYTWHKLKNEKKAVKMYKQALKFNAKHILANLYLGHSYFYSGDVTKSKNYYEAVIKIAPENTKAKEGLSRIDALVKK